MYHAFFGNKITFVSMLKAMVSEILNQSGKRMKNGLILLVDHQFIFADIFINMFRLFFIQIVN